MKPRPAYRPFSAGTQLIVATWFFLSGLTSFSFAQQIRWSAPLEEDNQLKYMRIIGSSDDDFFILRSNHALEGGSMKKSFRNRKMRLTCFSRQMSVRWDKVLPAPMEDGRILDVRLLNGRLLLSVLREVKGQPSEIYLQYLDANGSAEGPPVLAGRVAAAGESDEAAPEMVVSKNETRVALLTRLIVKAGAADAVQAIVCDTALAPLFGRTIPLGAGEQRYLPVHAVVSDTGDVVLLCQPYLAEKKKQPVLTGSYALFGFHPETDRTIAAAVSRTGVWLTDAGMEYDNLNHGVVVSGFYSDSAAQGPAGVFYFALRSADSGPGEVRISAFGNAFTSSKTVSKLTVKNDLDRYSIDRLLLRRDGGAVLVAEAYNTVTRSYYDYYMQMMITHTYYYYGSIITLSVSPDGSLLWHTVLGKEQQSTDDDAYYSSYCSAVYGAKVYFIYNKYIDNRTSVMLATVSSKGEQQTLVLFNEAEKILAVPRAALQIDRDVLLLPAYRQDRLCIARVSF